MKDAYEYVGNEVRQFWREKGIIDCVVLLTTDGYPHKVLAFCESDSNPNDVTFLYDFWEGEDDVRVQHIKPLWEILSDYRLEWEGGHK